MAASTREVFLLLRARDEASRVLRGFSSQLTASSREQQAAAKRAQAMALQSTIADRRRETAAMATLAAEKKLEAQELSKRIAQARANGATNDTLRHMYEKRRALQDEADTLHTNIRVMDKHTAAMVAQVRELERQSQELERLDRRHRQFQQALMSTSQAFQTIGAVMVGVAAVSGYFFVDSFNAWTEYNRQVALAQTQVDGFSASIKDISELGLKIGRTIPVAFQQIQPAIYDIFSSTSANLAQTEILLTGFAKAAVAGQTDVQTAARGTIAIINGLNIPFENVNHVLDVQFELVRKGVGTYDEFAKVFGRVIPAANRSQQTFETVAAMLAYMTRNGQSAAMASTAAARALELFTHPGAVNNLQQVGVKVRDLKGNFLPLIDILKQLRTYLLKLPQADRVAAIVDIFKGSGFNIQARRFLEQVVLGKGELEDFAALLQSMQSASGQMEEKYAQMADTAASKTQMLQNKWQALKIAVGEAVAPVMLQLVEVLGKLLDKFNNLSPSTKETIVRFAMIATAIAGVGGIALVFLGTLLSIVTALSSMGVGILYVTGVFGGLIAITTGFALAIKNAWEHSEKFRNFIQQLITNAKELWDILTKFATDVREAFDKKLGPALTKFWQVIRDEVLPVVQQFMQEVWEKARPKIVEALRIIKDIAEWAFGVMADFIEKKLIPAIRVMLEWWQKNKGYIMPVVDVLIQVAKWIAIIVGAIVAAGLIAALVAVATVVIGLVGQFMVFVEILKKVWSIIMDIKHASEEMWKTLVSIVDSIVNFFSSMIDNAKDAGKKIVEGLVSGMKGQVGKVADVAKLVAATISGFLPHSPAKTGPLSGKGSPYISGQMISAMVASGMLDKLGIVSGASGQVASAANPYTSPTGQGYNAPVGLGANTSSAFAPVSRNNVQVNVYTQEINPRATATELGWELEGKL